MGWQQGGISDLTQATSIATTLSQHLPHAFFCRPAELVAPDLVGCLPQTHPTPLLFLVEISEATNASSLVPLTPMPGAFVWGLLRNGG